MNDCYIVNGVLFGDEGKGSICDYLAYKHKTTENIRYNGGSQASHTVIVDGIKHKFSQLGSSRLNKNIRTYLSDNTIVNPFNLVSEARVLSNITNEKVEDILSNVYIDNYSKIVTPYHSLINKLRELSSKDRTGSVGSGVSEVNKIKDKLGLVIKVSDLLDGSYESKLLELFDYTKMYFDERKDLIKPELFEQTINEKDIYYLTNTRNREYIIGCYKNIINSGLLNIVNSIDEFHEYGNVLFEGSQGLLLDYKYGIKPNTTSLDTTNHYGVYLAEYLGLNVNTIGCIGAINTRHGMGVFPTYDKNLQKQIYDENQERTYFQGIPRYGWFDCVLTRYSLKYNPNSELFISGLDRLSGFNTLKICNDYIYKGKIDEEFKNVFDYYIDNKDVIITDIKMVSPRLKYYLLRCIPRYIELNGFKEDISQIKNYSDLPIECQDYISLIEQLINANITLVGVGASRAQKLERKLK